MDRKYKVYEHICPNGKIYIGITQQEPQKRWKNGEGYKTQQLFYKAIKKYQWNNIKHIILFDNLTKEEAEQKEIELIRQYQSNNSQYGYNLDNGGNCVGKMSEQTKRKIGQANKGNLPNKGSFKKGHKSFLTEEAKIKISKSSKGKPATTGSFKKGHIGYRKGISMSNETKMKIAIKVRKKVLQYDINGQYINEYQSLAEAAKKVGLKNSSHISSCCNNKRETAGGYKWEYKEKNEKQNT